MLTVEEIRQIHKHEIEEKKEAKKNEIREELKDHVLAWLTIPSSNVYYKDKYVSYEIDLIKEMEDELTQAGYKVVYKNIVWLSARDGRDETRRNAAIITWE